MSYQKQISGPTLLVTNTSNATSIDNGPVQIKGGCSIKKDLYIGGNLYVNNVNVSDGTVSTGSLQSDSGLEIGSEENPMSAVHTTSLNNNLHLAEEPHYIDILLAFKTIDDAISCEGCQANKYGDLTDVLTQQDKEAIYIEMDHPSWVGLEQDTEVEIKGSLQSANGLFILKPLINGYLIYKKNSEPLKITDESLDSLLVPDIGDIQIVSKPMVTMNTSNVPLMLNQNLMLDSGSSTFQQDTNFQKDVQIFGNLQLHNNKINFRNPNDLNHTSHLAWNHDTGFHLNHDVKIDGYLSFKESFQTINIKDATVDIPANTRIIELRLLTASEGCINEVDVKPGQILRILVVHQDNPQAVYKLNIPNMVLGKGIMLTKAAQTVELMLTSKRHWIYVQGSERHYDIIHD
jgi:hypothetical protein